MAMTCETLATESFPRPVLRARSGTFPGASAQRRLAAALRAKVSVPDGWAKDESLPSLGHHLRSIPDGETGERTSWIGAGSPR
jgi:hypothetical protein